MLYELTGDVPGVLELFYSRRSLRTAGKDCTCAMSPFKLPRSVIRYEVHCWSFVGLSRFIVVVKYAKQVTRPCFYFYLTVSPNIAWLAHDNAPLLSALSTPFNLKVVSVCPC